MIDEPCNYRGAATPPAAGGAGAHVRPILMLIATTPDCMINWSQLSISRLRRQGLFPTDYYSSLYGVG